MVHSDLREAVDSEDSRVNIDNVKSLLKRHEGYRNVPYKDTAGKTTVGWGHNMDANPLPHDMQIYLDANGCLLPEHCERLLDADIGVAVDSCKKLYPKFDSLPDDVQDVCIDWMFNVGIGTARKFIHFNLYINQGDWEAAAMELVNSLWCGQVKSRCDALVEILKTASMPAPSS